MNRPLAAVLDVVVVLIFVTVGRSAHAEEATGVLFTALPFLIALAVGWAIALGAHRTPEALSTGLLVWAVTWAGGLVLRNLVFHEGTALPFVVVAGIFLACGLIGWRAVARLVSHRRAAASDQ